MSDICSSAIITNIQRFSVHDGPGIRTTVFFKGCPLRCKWCQNPETNSLKPEILYLSEQCIGCGECIKACMYNCISVKDGRVFTDKTKCQVCGACAAACPTKTRTVEGQTYSVEQLMEILLADEKFYKNSGGGVTLSGGEVLCQSAFASRLLEELRKKGIHTAIETCGFGKPEVFDRVAERVELILFDIKHSDPVKHREWTGVDNALILENLKRATQNKWNVIPRFPLIPGVNDDEKTLRDIGNICIQNGLNQIHILPFHQAGMPKWEGLGVDYALKDMDNADDKTAMTAENIFKEKGLMVFMGGYC